MNNSILYTFHDIYLIVKENLYFTIRVSLLCLFLGILYTLFDRGQVFLIKIQII